jgi:hypothetical protein
VSGRSPRRPLGVRLWVRLTLVVAVLSVVPLVVVGAAAVQSARETARVRPEESLARHASTAATSVGGGVAGRRRPQPGRVAGRVGPVG